MVVDDLTLFKLIFAMNVKSFRFEMQKCLDIS
jgi:hypothetical protein